MQRIAFITDIHLDEQSIAKHGVDAHKNWERIISDFKSRNITEVIYGGDIGAPSSHKYFFGSLNEFSTRFILGNHDQFNAVSKYFNPENQSGELYYASQDDDYNYLFLDSSSGTVSAQQLDWIKQNLSSDKPMLVFIHHPILAVETFMDKKYPLTNRETVKTILENVNQQVTIFCGHYHMADEKQENNFRQIIAPSSSYQILKNISEIKRNHSEFGYTIIELDKDSIKTENIIFNK